MRLIEHSLEYSQIYYDLFESKYPTIRRRNDITKKGLCIHKPKSNNFAQLIHISIDLDSFNFDTL